MNAALPVSPKAFAGQVLRWFDQHGRKDLPWQQNPTPYRVWISEIMLQQTQVATVIPYYQRFMTRFPEVTALAAADEDQVLHLWTGLGYYARARNLHKAAKQIAGEFDGVFPGSVESLESLPGIGRSTAGAIAALAMNISAPILDGNVKRVLTRYLAVEGWPEQTAIKKQLWDIADQLMPATRVADYTQAMMDLGATVCTRSRPACDSCPLQANCRAHGQGLTDQIPGKKPRKALPVKTTSMLIFRDTDNRVLLEKRPPNGIWGSLFSFPETAEIDPGAIPAFLPVHPEQHQPLSALRHTFSHYHLDIQPLLFSVPEATDIVADSDRWLWYPLDHSLQVGLAAPVKKLMTRLSAQTNDPNNDPNNHPNNHEDSP